MKNFRALVKGGTLLCLVSFSTFSIAETLQEYAKQCEKETGLIVPDFNCDHGTVVPTTGGTSTYGGTCDHPNKLSQSCDPGSKFQMITNTFQGYVLAHCRRKGNNSSPVRYRDVAIIQHNNVTGATCFYQGGLSDTESQDIRETTTSGLIKSPKYTTKTGWYSTGEANRTCMTCHDNGPLIRSSYITQIKTGLDVIPGNGDTSFNKTHHIAGFPLSKDKYYMVNGIDQVTMSVSVSDTNGTHNYCTTCHDLSYWGNNDQYGNFTKISANSSNYFGSGGNNLLARFVDKPISGTKDANGNIIAPPEMPYLTTAFSQTMVNTAKEIDECMNALSSPGSSTLPSGKNCTIVQSSRVNDAPVNGSIILNNGKCLTVGGVDPTNSARLLVKASDCKPYDTNYPPVQQGWTYDIRLKTMSIDSMCLDLGNNTTPTSNQNLVLTSCSTLAGQNTSQQWQFDMLRNQVSSLKTGFTQSCITFKANETGIEGKNLTIANCATPTATAAQYASLQALRGHYIASTFDLTKAVKVASASTLTMGALQADFSNPSNAPNMKDAEANRDPQAFIADNDWVFERVATQLSISGGQDTSTDVVAVEPSTGIAKTKVNYYYRIRNAKDFKQMLILNAAGNGLTLSTTADPNASTSQWLLTNLPYATGLSKGFYGKHQYIIQSRSNLTKYINYNGTLSVVTINNANPNSALQTAPVRWQLIGSGYNYSQL
ncbi:MAG TPA: ricin-type beta-trefoil lectin domain protein [Cellvibrionaceae bacterium]